MGFDFTFRQADSVEEIKKARDFLAKQSLGYPNYDAWVQKTEPEYFSGYKQVMLAYSSWYLVGDLVSQPHKQNPKILEIKNIRIDPELRRRGFARFMLKQLEVEAIRQENFDAVIVDVRKEQRATIDLFTMMGYAPIAAVSLYDPEHLDVVMVKGLGRKNTSSLITIATSLFN